MFTDGMIVSHAAGNGSMIYAVQLTDSEGTQEWINGGYQDTDGRIIIPDAELVFTFDQKGVERFKLLRDKQAPDYHHTVIGHATIGDDTFVAFPSRSGKQIGLKPSVATESAGFAELA